MVRSKRCGCGSECTCDFATGPGTTVTPNVDGSFTIVQGQGNTTITVADSIYLDFTISGAGTAASPYVVTAVKAPGAPNPGIAMNTQEFLSTGTWTKPFADGWAEVHVWGGGGGGGGSGTNPPNSGYGGGGGGHSMRLLRLDELPDTALAEIGPGGIGGNGAPDSSTPGGNGQGGSVSQFASRVYAGGGGGGTPTAAGGGGHGVEYGGNGGENVALAAYADAKAQQDVGTSASGGGRGGFRSTSGTGLSTPASRDGGPGGRVYGGGFQAFGTGGSWTNQTPPTPGAGVSWVGLTVGGTGGGGGYGAGDGRSRSAGAAGGVGGGGGGGAGAGVSSGTIGGPGGRGRILVISWQAVV